MKKLITFTILLGISVFGVRGQQRQHLNPDTSHMWGLQDCMHFAIQNSPRAVRQQLANANTKTSYTQSILNHLPSLSASSGGNIGFGRGLDPETNSYTMTSSFGSSFSAGTGLPIFSGLSMLNNTRISKIRTLRGDEQLKQVEDDISLSILRAYYDFIYKMGTMKLALEMVDVARENLREGRKRMELGMIGLADVAQLEATLAGDEYNLVSIENTMRTSELNLKKQMNYPPSEVLKIDTTHRSAVPAPESSELTAIVNYAVTSLPNMLMSTMDLRISKLNLVTAKASLLPSLSASANIGTSYNTGLGEFYGSAAPFKSQFKNNLGYGVGMSMGIPIFSAWSRQFNIVRKRNDMRSQEQSHIETQRTLIIEVEKAVLELNGAYSEMEQAKKRLTAQRLTYRVSQHKFREGLLNALDLQTTSNQLLNVRAQLLSSELRWQVARKVVDYYKGIPLLSE